MIVYSGHPTLADQLIVNCELFFLLRACATQEQNLMLREEYLHGQELSHDNMERMLARLPLESPDTFNYALALTLAVG